MCSPAHRGLVLHFHSFESRTQVAVNSEGKTHEATKQCKEPLKQGQQKPTAKQKEKQDKAQDKSLKADKPKKSKGMKM